MKAETSAGEVRLIEVTRVDMLNTRERNDKVFDKIVGSIKRLGLKKSIAVTPRAGDDGTERSLLACGEGRLEAFKALGELIIAVLLVEASDEDVFIMSLAENIARHQCRQLELLAGIEQLREQRYAPKVVASRTGLTLTYVQSVLTLLQQGEQRLIVAVGRGEVPLNAAISIACAGEDDKAIQNALQEAYEAGTPRGKGLMEALKVIERQKTLGKSMSRATSRKREMVSQLAHTGRILQAASRSSARGPGLQGSRRESSSKLCTRPAGRPSAVAKWLQSS